MYDYLVVGSGLYGAIFAHEANKIGKKVLVVEKRENVGGTSILKTLKVSMFISMELISFILIIRKYGNILLSLLNLIDSLIVQ